MKYTLRDFDFYKMYQHWYYHCYYKDHHNKSIENDLEVGTVVKVNSQIGIICGLSGLNRNVYVIRKRSVDDYCACRYKESQLEPLEVWEYVNKPEYEDVRFAYEDYIERNHLNLCTAHFRTEWEKFQEGRLTDMELYYFHTPPEKRTIWATLKRLFKNDKKIEDSL